MKRLLFTIVILFISLSIACVLIIYQHHIIKQFENTIVFNNIDELSEYIHFDLNNSDLISIDYKNFIDFRGGDGSTIYIKTIINPETFNTQIEELKKRGWDKEAAISILEKINFNPFSDLLKYAEDAGYVMYDYMKKDGSLISYSITWIRIIRDDKDDYVNFAIMATVCDPVHMAFDIKHDR